MNRACSARTGVMACRQCKDIGIPTLNAYAEVGRRRLSEDGATQVCLIQKNKLMLVYYQALPGRRFRPPPP